MEISDLVIEYRNPITKEYKLLRDSTNWSKLDIKIIKKGLSKSLFSVCILHEKNITGMGRVVGDGSIYFYIQDVIVLPEFQKKGIGKLIMGEIMKYLEKTANNNSFIGLMAAEGVSGFYRKYNFSERPDSKPGMYLIWKK